MDKTFVTVIPAFRISTNIKPEVRIFSEKQSNLDINIIKNYEIIRSLRFELKEASKEISIYLDLQGIVGDIILEFCFFDLHGKQISTKKINYENF